MKIKKVKNGEINRLNKVCIKSILLYLLLLSCSSGDNRNYYLPLTNTPSYNLENYKNFSSTKKTDTTSFPLEVSTFSFFNLKESVDARATPQGIYTEELLNSFQYNYPKSEDKKELNLYTEIAASPWNSKCKLVHIGIYAGALENEIKKETPSKNVIFAIDTSGSMSGADRMDLAKSYLKNFIQGLQANDTISIVQYTNDARIFLKPTQIQAKNKILDAISKLFPSGGTNAQPGILLSYKLARELKSANAQTKVIIVTDGDFGGVNNEEFLSLVEKENRIGTTISIVGFGNGLNRVELMELLAKSKKGDSLYINSSTDIKKIKPSQDWITKSILASDLKVEVKFNPKQVDSFRLIGFENYNSAKEKAKVEVYPGFSYTALYEIIPTETGLNDSDLLEIKLNYRTGKGKAEEIKNTIKNTTISGWESTDNFRFAAGVAGLGMILNNSTDRGSLDYNMVIHLIQSSISFDPDGTRLELLTLANKLKKLYNN